MDIKIGFIGFGQIATAVCDGFLYRGSVPAENIFACAANREKLAANAKSRGINACASNEEVVAASDVVMIALVPEKVAEVIGPLADALSDKVVVSFAWARDCAFYESILRPGTEHISTIPNTPIAVGEGITVAESTHTLGEQGLALFTELFGSVGMIQYIDSAHFLTGGAMAGCTTAFAAMFIEALGDAGVRWGLSRKASYDIISQMIVGTGKLALGDGAHPAKLKDQICSPGGTTIIGVEALEEKGFRHALQHAINEILERE